MQVGDEHEEERLRQRLKQKQLERRKSKDNAEEVSKAYETKEVSERQNSIQNSSMIDQSTGGGGVDKKRSRSPQDKNDDSKRSSDGSRRARRKRGGRRRRRRREEPVRDVYRDNRDVWQRPYFDPRGGPPGYYDRYPYEYDRYPRERYERDECYRGPPPDRDFRRHDRDDRDRERGRSRSLSGDSYDSRSISSSRSRSYSRSNSRERGREDEGKRGKNRSSSRSSSHDRSKDAGDGALTKDQRTVFVSQLVMRADEYDIRRYFKKKAKCRVNEVIFLKDRRTGRHKGSAYVELAKLEDVPNAVKLSGQVPDFQRFPISIKGSDAEKNYDDTAMYAAAIYETPTLSEPTNGHTSDPDKKVENQNVYVGSIDRCVTQAQLFALFSTFGSLEKVSLQVDTTTGLSRGFAFLSYRDVKDANLAIQTMSGQQLAGRALKTGWANQPAPGIELVTSDEFPDDSAEKIQNAHQVLTQLTGSGLTAMASLGLATGVTISPSDTDTAEAAINAAMGVVDNTTNSPMSTSSDPKVVKGTPSCTILVHNMYDKDEETDEGWQEDIKEEFIEEASNYGIIAKTADGSHCVSVLHDQPGGMVFAQFETVEMAKSCAEALAGRWFDKRQIRAEYRDEFPF